MGPWVSAVASMDTRLSLQPQGWSSAPLREHFPKSWGGLSVHAGSPRRVFCWLGGVTRAKCADWQQQSFDPLMKRNLCAGGAAKKICRLFAHLRALLKPFPGISLSGLGHHIFSGVNTRRVRGLSSMRCA